VKLSIVIPSFKDPFLVKTIDSLLLNSALGSDLEIIAVLDGYWPSFELREDPRVRYVHLGRNRGMRDAINAGVQASRGEFIMRTDEHCTFAQGFDKSMTDVCRPHWIMTATRYFLNPVKWEVMDLEPVFHEKLVIQGGVKFAGQRWRSRDKKLKSRGLTETMAMQGSVWVMPRKWWDDVIGELQTEGYGPLYQDSHEMCFRTWQAGGELILNKRTWFAHKHRSFSRTHNYGTAEAMPGWTYSLNLWRDYYETVVRPKWNI
jgi:glycosyltransferase involved in cell wall biosynthesis